jgi:AraC-like DNA-binding protein
MIMTSFESKEYFGVIGNNKENVNQVYNCLIEKMSTKAIISIDGIEKMNDCLGAIAYVMDCQSDVHKYNLEYIHQNFPSKPLYILSDQISIPMLHHAIKIRAMDVIRIPIAKKVLARLSQEISILTNIECFERIIMPSSFIPEPEDLINHPLADLFEIIEQHYSDAPSLQEVSNRIYLSPSRISHMFKDLCGIGYCQYILCRRLEESEYLLTKDKASITQVSFQTGFSNPSHFCRSFKEHIGLTPTAYMKHEQGIEISVLYQRYQKLRMELLPISNAIQKNVGLMASSMKPLNR